MNEALVTTLSVLVCLQLKHFVGDYLLQTPWMIFGKGRLTSGGGYAHAGIHAVLSIPALLLAGLGPAPIALLVVGEFVLHYAIDFTKAHVSMKGDKGPSSGPFWALHGADQCVHQLSYVALAAFAVAWAAGG